MEIANLVISILSLIATIAISLVFFSYKYVLDAIIKYSFMIQFIKE